MNIIGILPYLFFGLITIVYIFWYIYIRNKFFLYLKNAHPDVWEQIGKPVMLVNAGGKYSKDYTGFLLSKDFHTQDPELLNYKKIFFIERIVLLCVFGILCVIVIMHLFFNQY